MQNLVRVMGPGCGNREVEDCPPMYHFELNPDELMGAIIDPSVIARELGLDVKSVYVSAPKEPAGPGAEAERTVYCCTSCLTDSICCTPWPKGSVPVIVGQ